VLQRKIAKNTNIIYRSMLKIIQHH